MAWYRFDRTYINNFKRTWPCHGLPDDLNSLSFEYARGGDLVDIVARNEAGQIIDTASFDGPALLALSHDAPEKGEKY